MTPVGDSDGLSPLTVVVNSIAVTVVAASPVFLVSSASELIRVEIDISTAALGAMVGAYFLAAAATSGVGGRLADRVGPSPSMALSSGLTAASLLGVSFLAYSRLGLTSMLIVGGLAYGLAQPAVSADLSGLRDGRPALAFGVRQAAIPMAALLSGGTTRLLSDGSGWRQLFLVGAAAAVVLAVSSTIVSVRVPARSVRIASRSGDVRVPAMAVLAFGALLAGGVATSLATLFVESAVQSGVPVATASSWLVWASLLAALARVLSGWLADRLDGRHLALAAYMLAMGSLAMVFIAGSDTPVLILVGGLSGFAFAWGWPGLMNFAVVDLNPSAPGSASGIVTTGAALGAGLGPLAFGAVADGQSFSHAWYLAAAAAALAAIVFKAVSGHMALHGADTRLKTFREKCPSSGVSSMRRGNAADDQTSRPPFEGA